MLGILLMMSVAIIIIFYAMIGYPLTLLILDKVLKKKKCWKKRDYEPFVSYMIVAHNEEKVIKKKLDNAVCIDYPKDKFQIIVASDYSTDATEKIVKQFILENSSYDIVFYATKEHKGKTNAQNEAIKIAKGDIVVMTDANAMLKRNSIRELLSYFVNDDISYVCGKLEYINTDNLTGQAESSYWNIDLRMRDIESRIQTITAGNGSLYAVKKSDYIETPPITCHDAYLPYHYARLGKRCLFNPDAISYEKAGEDNEDEFKRKVRMNRTILNVFYNGIKALNFFRLKWFSLFYFGHRTCRYLLWLMHLILFCLSIILVCKCCNFITIMLISLQIIAIILGIISIYYQFKNKILRMLGYYSMTVIAQIVAAYKQITGKSQPFWDKADSTR